MNKEKAKSKWILAEVVEKEYCLAKKVNFIYYNRMNYNIFLK